MKKTGTMMHMGVTKLYIFRDVASGHRKAHEWFPDLPESTTTDQLQKILHEDGREIFCSCDCEKDERGACTGNSVTFDCA